MKPIESLRLVSGPDLYVRLLPVIAAPLGLSSIAWLELSNPDRLAFLVSGVTLTLLLQLWPLRDADLEIVCGEQSMSWRRPGGEWRPGVIEHGSWPGSRYSVIRCSGNGWRKHLLISRSRQDEKTYRMMLAIIRLKSEQLHLVK